MQELLAWKQSARRKPLILHGARQVGKTWLLKEFGKQHFKNAIYINFDTDTNMVELFKTTKRTDELLLGIEAENEQSIIKGETLLIFDEIQESPAALTALKYFSENLPQLHVTAAGSLLGLMLHEGTGYPVGNADTLALRPFTFGEFLEALGHEKLSDVLHTGTPAMVNSFSAKAIHLLKQYYYVGGMPAAIAAYREKSDFTAAREEQNKILTDYRFDVSKHIRAQEVERILAVWDSIPRHLAQENKRFIFGQIAKGARGRDFKAAITWLKEAGLVLPVVRVTKPGIPLSAYADRNIFKLFLLDIGLLGAMAGISPKEIMQGDVAFTEFKGALAEQYVCQELLASCDVRPYYWSSETTQNEVDFLFTSADATGKQTLFGAEVKSAENVRSKSLQAFSKKYPTIRPLRFSLSPYREERWMHNIPLYAIQNKKLWGV